MNWDLSVSWTRTQTQKKKKKKKHKMATDPQQTPKKNLDPLCKKPSPLIIASLRNSEDWRVH